MSATANAPSRGWRGVVSDFGLLAVGEIIARVLGLATFVVIARRLGTDGFGVVVLGTTLVTWTALVVDAGTETIAVRDLGRDPRRLRSIAEPLLGLRLALAGVFGGLFGGAVLAIGSGAGATALALFSLTIPAIAVNPRFMGVAVRAAGTVAVGNVTGQAVLFVGALLLVHAGDVVRVPLLVASGELLYASVVIAALVRRAGRMLPRVDLEMWRTSLRDSRGLLAHNFLRAITYSADLLLIGVILGTGAAGQYGAAYKPVLFVSGGMGLFYVSLLAAQGADAGAGRQLARRALMTVPPVAAAGAAMLCVGAGLFVGVAYGPAFDGAAAPLMVLAWVLPVQAVGGVYATRLVATDHQDLLVRSNAWGAVANVALNLAVIPLVGITGAAAVTVLTELGVQLRNRRAAVRLDIAPAWPWSALRRDNHRSTSKGP